MWIDLLNSEFAPEGHRIDLLSEDFDRWASAVQLETTDPDAEVPALIAFRAALRPAFDALAQRRPIPETTLAMVNDLLARCRRMERLEWADGRYSLVETAEVVAQPAVSALARDFALLAAQHEPDRMKHCSNPACTLVFYDRGKNNRRRWCSMAACGNRHKVAHYRARKAAAAKGDAA
jgi:predicted RNA-binding Zn ribbon-like protein